LVTSVAIRKQIKTSMYLAFKAHLVDKHGDKQGDSSSIKSALSYVKLLV